MHDGGVFDADLHNKRLQVHGLFGPGAIKMRAEPLLSVHAPPTKSSTLQFSGVVADIKCNGQVPETSVRLRPWLARGTLLALHAGVFARVGGMQRQIGRLDPLSLRRVPNGPNARDELRHRRERANLHPSNGHTLG